MKRNIIIILVVLIAIVFGIRYLVSKSNNNNFYKESNQKEDIEQVDTTENTNEYKEESTSKSNDNENRVTEKVSKEDENITKEIGIKFIPLVHGYDLDNNHKDKVIEATKYTTESMKGFLIGTFINTKQPILYSGFYAREVSELKAVEAKVNDDSIMWEYEVKAKILNRNKEIINEERNRINLLFVKENNNWRVGEYSTTQYRE